MTTPSQHFYKEQIIRTKMNRKYYTLILQRRIAWEHGLEQRVCKVMGGGTYILFERNT
jgi:hypothetical protein